MNMNILYIHKNERKIEEMVNMLYKHKLLRYKDFTKFCKVCKEGTKGSRTDRILSVRGSDYLIPGNFNTWKPTLGNPEANYAVIKEVFNKDDYYLMLLMYEGGGNERELFGIKKEFIFVYGIEDTSILFRQYRNNDQVIEEDLNYKVQLNLLDADMGIIGYDYEIK